MTLRNDYLYSGANLLAHISRIIPRHPSRCAGGTSFVGSCLLEVLFNITHRLSKEFLVPPHLIYGLKCSRRQSTGNASGSPDSLFVTSNPTRLTDA